MITTALVTGWILLLLLSFRWQKVVEFRKILIAHVCREMAESESKYMAIKIADSFQKEVPSPGKMLLSLKPLKYEYWITPFQESMFGLTMEVQDLQNELEKAMDCEDWKRAAQMRDLIKKERNHENSGK